MDGEKPSKVKLKINVGKIESNTSIHRPASTSMSAANKPDANIPDGVFITSGHPVATPDAMSPLPLPPSAAPAASPAPIPISSTAAMPPPAAALTAPTPTEKSKRKIILKTNKSTPTTPVVETPPPVLPAVPSASDNAPLPAETSEPPKTKSGRKSLPTARKRQMDDVEAEEAAEANGDTPARPSKKQKIKIVPRLPPRPAATRTLTIKDNHKQTFRRDPGSGYDSEMEDVEEDPLVEEQIVFRMMDGPECDYLRESLDSKKAPGIDADFKLKWLDERRAAIIVRGHMFAAVLVDLPTITEGMKTWDRKMMVKSADICQMLLVFARVKDENAARTVELPKVLFDGYRWPHGLTPPMHDCVHRRFRKRLTKKEILNKEQEVERLLEADRNAMSSKWEWIDERRGTTAALEDEMDEDQDAEGEVDEDYSQVNGQNGAEVEQELSETELEAMLEAEIAGDDTVMAETPAQTSDTPILADITTSAAGSQDAAQRGDEGDEGLFGEDESVEDDDDDDDDDDESDEGLDPDEKARREEVRGVKEEIKELDRMIASHQAQAGSQTNLILKKRIEGKVKSLKDQRALKLASIGEKPDEDDD